MERSEWKEECGCALLEMGNSMIDGMKRNGTNRKQTKHTKDTTIHGSSNAISAGFNRSTTRDTNDRTAVIGARQEG